MNRTYLESLRKLKIFRKSLLSQIDIKRGKMYFSWIKNKTEKIQNEKDEKYFYDNIVNCTLQNYKIDKYTYERLDIKLKKVIDENYILEGKNYMFSNKNISFDDAMLITRKILFKRGNVVWIDFGFNIGNEFGGMHPAIILKRFDKELFVVPVSSKKPKEYKLIDRELKDKKITEEECKRKKEQINSILQIDHIYKFKEMIRWIDITRMRKVSILRINYSGTIGKINGEYLKIISKKIGMEF